MSLVLHSPHVPLVNAPPFGAGVPLGYVLEDAGDGGEPLSGSEAEAYLELTTTLEATLVEDFVRTARLTLEGIYDLVLIRRDGTASFRGPAAYLDLPVAPVASVASVVVTDHDGTETETLTANLDVRPGTQGRSRVFFADGSPVSNSPRDTIVASFTAGYADGEVPENVKTALRLIVQDLYVNRGTLKTGTVVARMPEILGRTMHGFGRVTV